MGAFLSKKRDVIAIFRVRLHVQIELPSFRRERNAQVQACGRKPEGAAGSSNELHRGLCWCSSALSLVTRLAGGHNILPRFASALDDRDDVIQRELSLLKFVSAILADVLVSDEHVEPREADHLLLARQRYILEESKHRGHANGESNRPYFLITFFDDFYLALEQQLKSPLPGHDVEGFERCV